MIATLFCALIPTLPGCSAYVDYVAPIPRIIHNEQFYSGKAVRVAGRVKALNQWRSRDGKFLYQAFFVCQSRDCIHVFLESPKPIRNDAAVAVRGSYYGEYRNGKTVTHNEIEATEVLPTE
ncbi:MAG TPA: hypothetical protein VGZ02_06905 [Candidatus Baltobacteraceae bacterium]|jgi:hypothetical protein|nr:hypothetical protein [Candidatus Baltobacteraceae bacterium]